MCYVMVNLNIKCIPFNISFDMPWSNPKINITPVKFLIFKLTFQQPQTGNLVALKQFLVVQVSGYVYALLYVFVWASEIWSLMDQNFRK